MVEEGGREGRSLCKMEDSTPSPFFHAGKKIGRQKTRFVSSIPFLSFFYAEFPLFSHPTSFIFLREKKSDRRPPKWKGGSREKGDRN